MTSKANKRARAKKIALWSFLSIFLGAMLAPLSGYLYVAISGPAHAQAAEETNPRANYWRAVREGFSGYSAVKGQEANVLIQNGGHNWRQWRNGPIATYGPWLLGLVVAALAVFFLAKGRLPVSGTQSGQKVLRWSTFERNLHWINAVMFIALGITGLSLLFGKAVLIPLLGPEGFAVWAEAAIAIHNLVGPVFILTTAVIILVWIRHNIPASHDVEWFKLGGGYLRKGKHPHAGRMNGGEKLWFWIIATVGVAVVVTGVILDFPNFGQTRETMQLSNLIHAAGSMIWIAFALGHIYMGLIATEGAMEGMTTGYVSKEWAQQHHDLWYEQVKDQQVGDVPAGSSGSPTGSPSTY
jgi:formate dehydrogenase subunit gamma